MTKQKEIFLILENIRSAGNVGSIFRTADAVGVKKIYLVGYTPAPLDRFRRANTRIAKTALGAEECIPWEKKESAHEVVSELQKDGVECAALEQSQDAISYKKYAPKGSVALILGNEVEGVSKEALSICDVVIEIPMLGEKESLNVSVASGIALYELALR